MSKPRLDLLYRALLRAEIMKTSGYRANIAISALGWVVPFVMLALWRGAAADGAIEGVAAGQFTTYFVVVLVTTASAIGGYLVYGFAPLVHEGRLAHYLVRPYHPMHNLVAQGIAENAVGLPTVAVLGTVVLVATGGTLAFGWAVPVAIALWIVGAVATLYVAALTGTLALWITKSFGLQSIVLGADGLLGGLYAPVRLLPGWLEPVARHSPFWFQVGAPSELVAGMITVQEGLIALAEAGAWVAALHVLFGRVWVRGVRQYELVGG